MAYLSSLKNQAKLLLSPSRVLRAPGTSPYHLVPKHLRVTWPRPEQSHLLPEACSPNGTNPATFSRDFTLYMTTKYAISRKRCLNYTACLTVMWLVFPFGNMVKNPFVKKIAAGKRLILQNISFHVLTETMEENLKCWRLQTRKLSQLLSFETNYEVTKQITISFDGSLGEIFVPR